MSLGDGPHECRLLRLGGARVHAGAMCEQGLDHNHVARLSGGHERRFTGRPGQVRMSEYLPFGSRGGLAVRHHFPVDGDYLLKIRLQRAYTDVVRGMAEPHRLEVRLDKRLLKELTVGGGGKELGPSEQFDYMRNADEGLEIRFRSAAGIVLVGAAFLKEAKVAEGVFLPRPPVASFEHAGKSDTDPAIDSIEIR